MNRISFLLKKWWAIQVVRKIIISWIISLVVIISLSAILYLSKYELHQSSDIISLNTELRSATLDLHTSIQRLESSSKQFIITGSKTDSVRFRTSFDSIKKNQAYLERLIKHQPQLIKYFQPIQKTITEELYHINSISSFVPKTRQLKKESVKNEEEIYNKIDNYWQLLDNKLESATFEQIQVLHSKINKNLNYFLVLIIIYISLLSLLFLIIIFDVKKRRKMSEEIEESRRILEELNNQKTKFFSIIAHDLRSPFAGIIGLAEIIIEYYDKLSDEEKKTHLEGFYFSLKDLLALIDNLLTWSRFNFNRISFDPSEIHLDEIICAVFKSLEVVAKNKHIELKSNFNNDIKIIADADMIETVIRNLVSNAIKFTQPGGIINVDVGDQNDIVKFDIEDNGIGMSDEIANSLFRLDFNIKTKGTNNENGTGLGLIICKEFVEKHSGNILVKSKVGKGTIVSFTLPKIQDITNQKIL